MKGGKLNGAGQPYAFRQAGLFAGAALLIGLTITVFVPLSAKVMDADTERSTGQFVLSSSTRNSAVQTRSRRPWSIALAKQV